MRVLALFFSLVINLLSACRDDVAQQVLARITTPGLAVTFSLPSDTHVNWIVFNAVNVGKVINETEYLHITWAVFDWFRIMYNKDIIKTD